MAIGGIDVKGWLVSNGFTWNNVINFMGLFLLLLVSCIIFGTAAYFYSIKKKYSKTIYVFEKINGVPQRTRFYKAAEIVIANGVTAFHLKGTKIHLPKPTIPSAKDTFWYMIDNQGNWHNVGIESFDETTKRFKLVPDNLNLRSTRASFQKLLQDNYRKQSWIEKYAPYIALAGLCLIVGIMVYLCMDKVIEAIGMGNKNIEIAVELSKMQKELLGAMDNVCSSGGMRTAT